MTGTSVHSIETLLRTAIGGRRLISLCYARKLRVVEPHDYGIKKEVPRLLAYQLSADGRTGRGVEGWRLFDVAKLSECRMLDDTFAGSRGQWHDDHRDWDQLFARVK